MKTIAYKDYKIKMAKTYNREAYIFTNRLYFQRTWLGKNVINSTYAYIKTNEMDLDSSDYLNINILPRDAIMISSN